MGKLLHLAYEAGVLALRFLRRIWTLVKTMFLFGRDIPLLENVSRVYFSYLYLPMLVVTAVFFLNGALHLSYNLLIPLDSITLLLLYLPAYVYACTGLVFLGYKTMTLVADTMSDCYHSKGNHQYYYLKIRLKRAWVRHPVHLGIGLAALPAALCRVVPAGVFGTWTRPASASFSSRASSVLCAELVILTQAVFVTASYWAKRRAAARRGTPVAACLGATATASCVDRTFFFTVFWPWVVPKVRDFSLFQLCCAWVVWFVRHDFLIASSRVVEASVYLLAPHVALNGVCALILAVGEVQASVAFLLRNRDKMLEVVLLTCGYVLWGAWSVCVLPSSAVIALAVSSCSALLVRATQVVSGGAAGDEAADEAATPAAAAAAAAAVGPHGSDGFASSCVGDGRAGRRKRRQRRRTPARTAAASAAAAAAAADGAAGGEPAEAAAAGGGGSNRTAASSVTVVAPKKKRKRSKQEAGTAAAGAAAAVKARREAAAAAAAADGGHYTDGDFSSYYYSEELGFGSVGRDEAARRAGEPRYYLGSFTFHQLVTTATSYLERLSLIVFFHSSLVDHAEDTSAAVAAHWGGAAAAAAAAAGHPTSAELFSGQDVRDWALAGEEAEDDGDDEAAAAAARAAAVGLRRARSLGSFEDLRHRRPASPPPPPQALACMADQVKWRVRCRIVIRVLGAAAVLLIVNLTLAAAVQNVLPEGFRGKHSSVLTVYNEGASAGGGRGPGSGAGEGGGRYRRKRFTFTVDGMMQAAECVAKVGYREAVGLYDTTLARGLAHAEASFLTNTTEEAWARIQSECFEGRAAGGAAACAAVPTAAHGTSPSRLTDEEDDDDASAITLHHLVVGLTLGRAGGGGAAAAAAAAAGGAQTPHRKRLSADGYPTLCRRKWDGVDALAYALFSSMSYLSPRDFRRALRFYNSVLKEQEGRDWVLRYSAESEGINSATFFDVHSASRNLSVIVIRGTSPISPLDYLQNVAMYVEVGIYQASTLLLPLFGMLPQSLAVDAIAASSGYEYLFHGLFGTIAKREYLTYYWEHVQRYAERRKAEGVNIVLAGHSMGGAISMIVGSRVGNRGISFHSPGISLSHRKFGIRSVADIHRHTTSIVPENDAITAFDKHGGEVHNTLCAGKRHDACHLMEATVMELWSACPTLRRKLDLDTVSIDFAF